MTSFTGSSLSVQQDLPSLILTLLDDISSRKLPESLDSFKQRILRIYQAMDRALQETRPNANFLERNIEWLKEEIPKLYENLKTHLAVDVLVQSTVFKVLIPDSATLKKDHETNYNFFYRTVSPVKLSKYPNLQSSSEILELLTLIPLSTLSTEDLDRIRKALDLPPDIQKKVLQERIRIGTLLKESFTQQDCAQLIQLFNGETTVANEKAHKIWAEYSQFFDQLGDSRQQIFDSIKTGLRHVLSKLPEKTGDAF